MILRKTVLDGEISEDDYIVKADGRSVGRIRLASERPGQGEIWDWTISVPLQIPAWGSGSAATLFDAKDDFKNGMGQI